MSRVRVYWNSRQHIFSIQFNGRVIARSAGVLLADVVTVVRPAGLKKARKTGVRSVYAFLAGEAVRNADVRLTTPTDIRFSATAGGFVDPDGFVMVRADVVHCRVEDSRPSVKGYGIEFRKTGRKTCR